MKRHLKCKLVVFLTITMLSFPVLLFGQSNYALQFDGYTGYVNLGTWFNLQTFTIELWVNPGEQNAAEQWQDILDNNHSDTRSWAIQRDRNTNSYSWGTADGSTSSPFTLTAGQWSHIALTRNRTDSTSKVYINGVLQETRVGGTRDITYDGTQSLFLATHNMTGWNRDWNGKIDDLRIWNTVRSQAEIIANMNIELAGNESGLFAYYKMNEGSETSTADSKGTNHGTLIGGVSWVLSDAPLPVELTSFTANSNGSSVSLNWQTATEVNNYGFSVERRVKSEEWEKISFVQGHGNSNSPKNYSFVDLNLPCGTIQYRLKQIDIDGAFEYSDVVEVAVNAPSSFALHQNYPNPFNPTTKLKFGLPEHAFTKLIIYDVLGREVETLISTELSAGNYEISFDGSKLTSGIYFYRIQANDFTSVKKLILMK